MLKFIFDLQYFLEKIDSYRDKLLFLFIKPYWPRKITPNAVTWLRVVIAIALFVLLFWAGIENKALIVWLFCIGVITDLIDGPVARGTNRVTEFGAMLDSTSDRLLLMPIAFYGLYKFHKWLLLILILVEIANAIVSLFYKSKEIYLESNIFGKTKMVLMCIPFICILVVWPGPVSNLFIYMLWLTIPFSFFSALTRIVSIKNQIKTPFVKKIIEKYEK